MTLTGIVLAGGRSTRFGSDKLAQPLGDTTLLEAAILALTGLVDGVIVAGSALPEGFEAGDVPVALVRDPEGFPGPLVALANVLSTAAPDSRDVAIVVGGDMPRLAPPVLVAMVETLDADPTIDAVLLTAPEAPPAAESAEPPRRQVLPLAVRVQPASRVAREAVEAGQRSLNALVDRMAAFELPASVWLALDPEGGTLTDVDTRADLERLRRQ